MVCHRHLNCWFYYRTWIVCYLLEISCMECHRRWERHAIKLKSSLFVAVGNQLHGMSPTLARHAILTKKFAIRDWLLRGKLILILRAASGWHSWLVAPWKVHTHFAVHSLEMDSLSGDLCTLIWFLRNCWFPWSVHLIYRNCPQFGHGFFDRFFCDLCTWSTGSRSPVLKNEYKMYLNCLLSVGNQLHGMSPTLGKTCFLTKKFTIRDWLLRGKLLLKLRTTSGWHPQHDRPTTVNSTQNAGRACPFQTFFTLQSNKKNLTISHLF
jgi:hypothetical protein